MQLAKLRAILSSRAWLTSVLCCCYVFGFVVQPASALRRLTAGNDGGNGPPADVVVFQTLNSGLARDLCANNNTDWRGSLPRYLARTLPDTAILIWDGLAFLSRQKDCRVCHPETHSRAELQPGFFCEEWFAKEGRRTAKEVVIMGSYLSSVKLCTGCDLSRLPRYGSDTEKALKLSLQQPWVGRDTRSVHFPISNNKRLTSGKLFRFSKVIKDSSFLKAVEQAPGSKGPMSCGRPERVLHTEKPTEHGNNRRHLLYVARMESSKGQEAFLRLADPFLLRHHHIVFYAGKNNTKAQDIEERLWDVARRRNISIEVHLEPVSRWELQRRGCQAEGLLLFAKRDRNPRALYEGLYAGLPMFVTNTAGVPRQLKRQQFVVSVEYAEPSEASGQEVANMNSQLRRYLQLTANRGSTHAAIQKFVTTDLRPEKVYSELSRKMGLGTHVEVK